MISPRSPRLLGDFYECPECGETYHRKSQHDCPGSDSDRINKLEDALVTLAAKVKDLETIGARPRLENLEATIVRLSARMGELEAERERARAEHGR